MNDPGDSLAVRERLLDELDSLNSGDDIFLETVDGERFHVRYRSHDNEVVVTYKSTLRDSEDVSYQMAEIFHIEQADTSVIKTIGAVILGLVAFMAVGGAADCAGGCS